VRYQAAKQLLDLEIETTLKEIHQQQEAAITSEEQLKFAYVACLGIILGEAAKAIFLQYLSEDLVFPPPDLSLFESQLQTASYLHLSDFLSELSSLSQKRPPLLLTDIYLLLKNQITSDLSVFQEENKSSISQELSTYFSRRYESLRELSDYSH
jgi:hypothetical protein